MAKKKAMARKSLGLNLYAFHPDKNYMVIQIMRKGAGYGKGKFMKPLPETFEQVNWFTTFDEAIYWFRNADQEQTATDGECNRVLAVAIKRFD